MLDKDKISATIDKKVRIERGIPLLHSENRCEDGFMCIANSTYSVGAEKFGLKVLLAVTPGFSRVVAENHVMRCFNPRTWFSKTDFSRDIAPVMDSIGITEDECLKLYFHRLSRAVEGEILLQLQLPFSISERLVFSQGAVAPEKTGSLITENSYYVYTQPDSILTITILG